MRRLSLSPEAQSGHQQSWGGAFAEGLSHHGWRVSLQGHPGPCDMLVLWGVRNQLAIKAQKRAGGEVCILERGYVGDRLRVDQRILRRRPQRPRRVPRPLPRWLPLGDPFRPSDVPMARTP